MSSDKSLNLANDESRKPLLQQGLKHRLKTKKHKRDGKKKKKKTAKPKELKLEWELETEEANKTLYMCIIEFKRNSAAYVVRTIKLSDLLSSDDDDPVPLRRQVAYMAGSHLPGSVGCGVWGSQIVFTGGMTPCCCHGLGGLNANSVWHTNVYAFETHTDSKEIRKLDANLQGPKFNPLTVELCGKLYALSYWKVGDIDAPSFEVFDPEIGKWECLPQPSFFQLGSPYYRHLHGNFSYAIAGTKIFACHDRGQCPVFCFDVAHPNREWRQVSTMCEGDPFPFINRALVLDLPEGDDDKKIMFAFTYQPWRLLVYIMSLSENQETITKIGEMRMPKLPEELGSPGCCEFVHIGGQKACLVVTETNLPEEVAPLYDQLGRHKAYGAVIPFHFHLDMTKPKKSCLTLQFMPLRSFKYRTNPSTYPDTETVGCFLL